MGHKITFKNIASFIEGNANMIVSELGAQPQHLQEQFAYRMLKCKDDCMITKECIKCGCSVPGRLFTSESCNNGERFPDLMSRTDWEEYKKENDI